MVLPSTAGREVDVAGLGTGRTLIYCYPRTGVPGEDLPDGWDAIPGARGCTPQACAFRDHQGEETIHGAPKAPENISAVSSALCLYISALPVLEYNYTV